MKPHRLITHQVPHELCKVSIRLHQRGLRTDKIIRHLPHGAEEGILKDEVGLVHPVGDVEGELIDFVFIARDAGDLGDDDFEVGVLLVHVLDEGNGVGGFGAVVVEAEEVGRVALDEGEEFVDPVLAVLVVGAAGADELFAVLATQGEHLVVPVLLGFFGADAVAFGLVEEVHDVALAVEDVLPVLALELGFQVHHWAVRGTALEFGRYPCVPVADGFHGAFEVHGVHGPGDTGVARTGGVGPVPEKTALANDHLVERKIEKEKLQV